MALPKFFMLKSNYNNKYLQYINEDVEVHRLLQFTGEEVVSPYIKFEAEMAKSGKGLVNIKCCYNNKYWRRWSDHHWWIAAGADEPEEDQSKWSCTLFEPTYIDAKTVRFRHVQLGHYAFLWRAGAPYTNGLYAADKVPQIDFTDVTIINWESLALQKVDKVIRDEKMALPKFFVLKSNYNNKYLQYIKEEVEVHRLLQFTGEEVVSPYVKFEAEMAKSGKGLVNIKCCYNNKYWRRWSDHHWWIAAGADEPEEDQSKWSCTLFEPTYIDAKTIRFRHVQLGHYAFLWRAGAPYTNGLYAADKVPQIDFTDVKIINWESLELPKVDKVIREEKMALPKFFVLKSNYNNKYLQYIKEDVEVHRLLQYTGEEVVSPYVKFEAEMAKCGKGLVNIRCCYNNKYWRRWSDHHWWIAAGADEPEEDQSKWSCTLFEPTYIDAKTIRFRHVQLGHYAFLWRAGAPYTNGLYAADKVPQNDFCNVTIIDWESLVILPKHIAFKGDNDNYLNAHFVNGKLRLHFSSTNIGVPSVGNEIFTTSDGSIRIKNNYFGKFWRNGSDWIWADSDDTSNNNIDTLFWPIKIDNHCIALRSAGNSKFCKRFTINSIISGFSAYVSTIDIYARLKVEETVLSRNIYNVNFRPKDSRIYNLSIITLADGIGVNKTQQPSTINVKLPYIDTKCMTWNSSVSLKLGITSNIETAIPLIVGGKIKISGDFIEEYKWGVTKETKVPTEGEYNVTVPPMTTVKVTMRATKGSCDVPFSYSQRDTLTNGQHIIHTMDDGVYTGINCFNFKYVLEVEQLS